MLIYKVTFPNSKSYIGQTTGPFNDRKSQHISDTKKGSKLAFHNALRFYEFAVDWQIIDTAKSLDELNRKEAFYIRAYNTIVPSDGGNGYNLTYGGNNIKFSLESRKKMSDSKKGKMTHSSEFYKDLGKKQSGSGNPFYGKKHSEETKSYISEIQKGKKLKEETKAKISKANKGRKIGGRLIWTDEQKATLGLGSVIALNAKTGEIAGEFYNAAHCARILNLSPSNIGRVLKGLRKTSGGFTFKRGEQQ